MYSKKLFSGMVVLFGISLQLVAGDLPDVNDNEPIKKLYAQLPKEMQAKVPSPDINFNELEIKIHRGRDEYQVISYQDLMSELKGKGSQSKVALTLEFKNRKNNKSRVGSFDTTVGETQKAVIASKQAADYVAKLEDYKKANPKFYALQTTPGVNILFSLWLFWCKKTGLAPKSTYIDKRELQQAQAAKQAAAPAAQKAPAAKA